MCILIDTKYLGSQALPTSPAAGERVEFYIADKREVFCYLSAALIAE